MSTSAPLPAGPPRDVVDALRADLAASGWTVDGVDGLLGPVASAALAREQAVPAREVTAGRDEPVAVLTRAFVLGLPVTRGALDASLPRTGTDGLVRLGLVEAAGSGAGDDVRALLDLRPYAAVDATGPSDWWVVSDLGETATGRPLRTDHVLGVGGASTTLARATVRGPVDRTLDLGTGCGVQALHASRHSRSVVATDLSDRALRVAALTLALAGVCDRVDLRRGDMLDPVAGERFDLVVSNPPFVITPRRGDVPAYEYRDGGRTGDAVVADLVRALPGVLAAGGTAQLLGNWEVHGDAAWTDRVGQWLDGTGLDAWVVQREVQDPAEYAETWIRDGGQRRGAAFDDLYRAWLDDLAARDVSAVGFGVLTLRVPPPGRPPWRCLEERTGPVHQPLGEHLGRALSVRDLLAGPLAADDALLASRWRVAADVTEERHHRPGEPDPAAILLRQTDGFGRVVQVGTTVAAAVGACDGELTLGRICGALGALLDAPVESVRADVLPVLRDLAHGGLLVPA
ncbi:DUF7059 domain-containing protein [Thalassiella azotivora]